MLIIPTNVLLTWPARNSHNPARRGPELWIVSAIFLSIATISVGARLYSRIFIRRWFGPDDVLIVVAYLSTIGVVTCAAIGNAKYDWDKHMWDASPTHYSASAFDLYLSRIFWGVATSCVRLSILCLYYRLLDRCQGPRHFRWILHGVTSFTVILLFAYLFTGVLPCYPVRAYWVFPAMPNQHCIDDGLSMQVAAIINTTSEIVIALLPVLAVSRLGVDPRQRWNVLSLLSLGGLVAFAGCWRTYYLWKTVGTYDMTWWSTPHWICSEVEIDTALTCACAAPLRPLVGSVIRRLRGLPSTVPTHQPNHSQLKTAASVSTNLTDSKMSSVGIGRDSYSEWNNTMSRTIDLEGIGEDGFGYTVTITGPGKRRRKLRKNRKAEGQQGEELLNLEEAITALPERKLPKKPFGVATTRTFEVTSMIRPRGFSEESLQWGSTSRKPSDVDVEAGIEESAMGLKDWSLLDSPEEITTLPAPAQLKPLKDYD